METTPTTQEPSPIRASRLESSCASGVAGRHALGRPQEARAAAGVGPVNDYNGNTLTLNMMVNSWNTSRAEWDSLTNWTIELLEI
jgi:hypothetical protein